MSKYPIHYLNNGRDVSIKDKIIFISLSITAVLLISVMCYIVQLIFKIY